MTDRDALLAAIHADPDDDTARLVYADWLQENGQPDRADFIRSQIEAARADPFGPRVRKAEERATRLLETHRQSWTRHIHPSVEWPRFERGFVAQLSVEPVGFVPRADVLLDLEPVQGIKLFRYSGSEERVSLESFFDLPRLRQLRQFELSPMLISDELYRDEEFGLLSSCRYLEHLRELSLRYNPVPPSWLAEVLRKSFPELIALDIADNSHLAPCLSDNLPPAGERELKKLDVSRIPFNSDQLQRILKSRCLRRVEELRLAIQPGSGAGPLFYLDLGFVIPWDRLVVLDLSGQWIGNDGVREITATRESAALRWLGLAHNGLGADAVRYLCDSRHLALNYLDVKGNNLTLSEIAALSRRFPDAVIESQSARSGLGLSKEPER